MKKVLSLLLICTCLLSTMSPMSVNASTRRDQPSAQTTTVDIGPRLRYLESNDEERTRLDEQVTEALDNLLNENEAATSEEESPFTFNGGTKIFFGYDVKSNYYPKNFTLRSIGDNVEVWVADDLSYKDNRLADVVTQEQVDRMKDEFDDVIYPKDTSFFGQEDSHTGVNASLVLEGKLPEGYYVSEDGVERTIILVDNVKDENYHNGSYPFIIAGFFTGTFERYTDRNIVTIDSSNWARGLDSKFATLAHEYQHLIHSDNDASEETWINEGMSDFAQYLCGYGHPMGHVNFFLSHPENCLVNWDEHKQATTGPETLADYGQAYLLMLYMYDHYGQDFIKNLAKSELQGIASINKMLETTPPVFGSTIDFEELFRRFSVALVVDDSNAGFDNLYFKSIDTSIDFEAIKKYDKDGIPAWGADYKKVDTSRPVDSIEFDGSAYSYPWKVQPSPTDATNSVYWADSDDLLDNLAIVEVDLRSLEEAKLTFDQYYDIEDQWDYAFVQVSEDGGDTWKSIATGSTQDAFASAGHPGIKANLPGYTGTSNGWVSEEIDLSQYAGKEILIGFRYMTDWGTTNSGWYLDNIKVEKLNISLVGDSKEDLASIYEIKGIPMKFAIALIMYRKPTENGVEFPAMVKTLSSNAFKDGKAKFYFGGYMGDEAYLVSWYAAPVGDKNSARFSYKVNYKE